MEEVMPQGRGEDAPRRGRQDLDFLPAIGRPTGAASAPGRALLLSTAKSGTVIRTGALRDLRVRGCTMAAGTLERPAPLGTKQNRTRTHGGGGELQRRGLRIGKGEDSRKKKASERKVGTTQRHPVINSATIVGFVSFAFFFPSRTGSSSSSHTRTRTQACTYAEATPAPAYV